MSHYYGFYCEKCDESSEFRKNHGDDALKEILQFWPLIRQLLDKAWFSVDILGDYDDEGRIFLEQHFEHGILIESEYGERFKVDEL